MAQKFVVGIIEDKTFGPLARPLIINKLEEKGFFPIEAQLSELNHSRYAPQLSRQEKDIYEVARQYSEKNLYQLFGSKKDQTVKEFLQKVKPEYVEQHIRPFIEKRVAQLTDLLRKTDIEVYLKEKHKFINRDNEIKVLKEQATTLFNIEKLENETRYNLAAKQGGEEIQLIDKHHIILSHDPCRLIIDNRLYAFEDIDANKLKPFFRKEYIIVPQHFEKRWFESFALPNIKKYSVNARGFDIETIEPEKKAVLSLTRDLNYQSALLFSFFYGEERFLPESNQTNKVVLESHGQQYRFFKIERDMAWEEKMLEAIRATGLINTMGSFFSPERENGPNDDTQTGLHELLEWLGEHSSQLKDKGISLDTHIENKTYCFPEFSIESEVHEHNDWFDVKATVRVGGYRFSFVSLRSYIAQGIREIRLPNGEYALLPREWFTRYGDLFKFGQVENDHLKINKFHFRILEKTFEKGKHQYLERLKELTENFHKQELGAPKELLATLRPYQLKGYRWMHLLNQYEFGGCLADDMGLGKTLQTLTLLLEVKNINHQDAYPRQAQQKQGQLNLFDQASFTPAPTATLEEDSPVSLIVMPTSLVYNWEDEIRKFTPQLTCYRYTGVNRTRRADELYQYDIVLTTYGIVRNDYELLRSVDFHYLILDESQYIKNPESKIYKAVNELQSKHKLVLTGTPIENSLSDLWAQFNFLNKGLLGSYHFFKQEFMQPIEKHNDQEREAKLQAIIDPFILRRTKHQVAPELPEKTEQVIHCQMTEPQWSIYEREKSMIRNAIIEHLEGEGQRDSLKILDGLSRLRQIANHPRLIEEDYQGESGKFNEILDYLENLISENHKVLVFSSYKKHLRLLESHFRRIGWRYSLLTGETYNRQQVIRNFQDHEENRIFLIQIKAGGFGLNLTAADYVLILDPWWNPAVEEQAVNRAHRIGQDKKVMVYRFISTGTVEEKIQRLQNRKARLAETFITPSETLKQLSRDQLLELFG
jgi:SNF2 family DNA or RNA helicase